MTVARGTAQKLGTKAKLDPLMSKKEGMTSKLKIEKKKIERVNKTKIVTYNFIK